MSQDFFLNEENVKQYIEMTSEYDGAWFYNQFKHYVPTNFKALELGMGSGIDLNNIRQHYDVVGSDYSFVFAELYKRSHPEVKIMILDAVSIKTDAKFDCIYSNKVLHHLSSDDLKASIKRQSQMLESGAIVFHTFWNGSGSETYDGLLFNYYDSAMLNKLFADDFEIIDQLHYQEFKVDDSILLIAKKK